MFSGYGVSRSTTATRLQGSYGNTGASAAENVHTVNNTITCETPMPNLLPPIPTGRGEERRVGLGVGMVGVEVGWVWNGMGRSGVEWEGSGGVGL